MYHFDYVGKRGGTVFEDFRNSNMVILNGQKQFGFDKFISIFVLIENYKHPFTICTSKKRYKQINKRLGKMGYVAVMIKQIDFDMEEENAFLYGVYHVDQRNPFKEKSFIF